MKAYLIRSKYIDFDDRNVREKAVELSAGLQGKLLIAEACYTFVRDEIQHSWDYRKNPVTCRASEVLKHRTGYCYSKSHLLAALLRANGIPAGLCYQRLSVGDSGSPYCLHALNAVYLEDYGWYRCDSRGNKTGINALFTPPHETLAFAIRETGECDLPEIWAEPLPVVTEVLERYSDVADVHANLPDIELWANQADRRMTLTMRTGQIKPNEFELAILDRLASKEPALRGAVGQLHVLSREFTGVGSYTNFACEDSSADAPDKQVVLDELITMPGVPNGMGAVLFCKGDRPKFLEVFTYGDDHWEGVYGGFTIEETA